MTDEDWAGICRLIQSALDRGGNTHALEHVFNGWRSGGFQIWAMPGAVIVTEVLRYPLRTELNYWLAGADRLEDLEAMEPQIEAFAKAAGCSRVKSLGVRRGGLRVMQKHGFRHEHDVLVKDI